ncbi:hypothetical protein H2204_010273 [Knufia peltigerae]|uniref:Alpha/beta hydrolase fold-3 domain-containing protein n=1 Tax=Knufia peltigerae TaxID=1002370 RepID=A0AA38XWF3_9EURO|nr:hypothetical protein H2204_010273 [Knufia peltigerae]
MAPAVATPSTRARYMDYTSQRGFPEDEQSFGDFSVFWLGNRDAASLLVFFHGGGFMYPAQAEHLKILGDAYDIAMTRGRDVSIAIVDYGLAPASPYPTQLRQAVAFTNHLLSRRESQSINFFGDSAGGLLILMLLLHKAHQHPTIDPLALQSGQKFGQALLLSPSGPIASSAPSMFQDPPRDFLTLEMLKGMQIGLSNSCEQGHQVPNEWIAPATAPEEWWIGLPIAEIDIILGDDEILRDDILVISDAIKKHHYSAVNVTVGPNELHIQPVFDLMKGTTLDSTGTTAMKAWFNSFKG